MPSCAIRARRWLSTGLAGSGGAAFPLKTGSVLLLGTKGRFPDVERVFPEENSLHDTFKVNLVEMLTLPQAMKQFCGDANKILEVKVYKTDRENNNKPLSLPIVFTPVEISHAADKVRGILALQP